ncbi:MAG: hypothetical protein Q9163_002713 [Psora crenata]
MASPRGDTRKLNQPLRYNDATIIGRGSETDNDPFKVSETHGGKIMPDLVAAPDKYVSEAFEPFKARLRDNWAKGFKALMKYDNFSARGFMMSHGITPLDDYYSLQWLETLTDGSGLYDQAFSEAIFDSLDFDYYSEYIYNKKVDWKCVEGGAQKLPEAMNAQLKRPLAAEDLEKKVTKIALNRPKGAGDCCMKVKVDGEEKPRTYMTVFATPTLACIQRMDLSELELLYEQKDAIRSLHYDTASKVGMKFREPWWIKLGIQGGLGKRSLMKGDPLKETELKHVLLDNLARLHLKHFQLQDPSMDFEKVYKHLNHLYLTHHAFDWHNHEFTSGAYGKFGPGQFTGLYNSLSSPTADSRFHFVGEAISAHHGWIVGALDSAHQAVLNFLRRFHLVDAEKKLKQCPFLGPTPDDIDKESATKRVVLGLLKPKERLEARNEIEKGLEILSDAKARRN